MDPAERAAAFHAAVALFDTGRYLAAHELFEELWEESEGGDSDFYKGLIQATIALQHFAQGNLDGAAKLYAGHRRCLAGFLPRHRGLDVERFLADMQRCFTPLLHRRSGETVALALDARPRLANALEGETGTR